MQQSKRTTAARVILGTPQSLYFWLSIGLRWPKRKGAAEHCAHVPIAARPQPTVWAGVVGFRRSVIHVGAHSPRVRYALDRFCARLTAFRREALNAKPLWERTTRTGCRAPARQRRFARRSGYLALPRHAPGIAAGRRANQGQGSRRRTYGWLSPGCCAYRLLI